MADALKALFDSGVPVYFIRGNRDFLLGEDYARRAGLRILPDPCVIELYGRPVLLQHGDLLCTDDIPYQQFRAQTRDPAFRRSSCRSRWPRASPSRRRRVMPAVHAGRK